MRQRLKDGFYNDDKVLETMADRLVEGALEDAGPTRDSETIQRRVSESYYDREQVVDKTAENMLKSVLPRK